MARTIKGKIGKIQFQNRNVFIFFETLIEKQAEPKQMPHFVLTSTNYFLSHNVLKG